MESNKNNRPREEIALERYKIISPILSAMDENADKAKIGLIKAKPVVRRGSAEKPLNS